ncbi:hypothetical protein AVEN_66594-1 [Araneus ventricosus]|uniref:DUF5641 domain-containing protein n=1 Tax=Araneus ventricosus TaxID=182803 RepID=A0A4Y2M0J0_ARAVE|nr:hypothetical protein AVEN_66594-1 [Araneus ventricosus]
MDDILTGSNSLENTKELQTQLVQLLGRGGMTLHKWCSNNESLLNKIQNSGDYQFTNPAEMKPVKTLGVLWKPNNDCFSFKVTISQQHSYTKRSVLSDVSRIYDPLGLIGPIVSKAKIFMQRLWLLKLGWDEPLSEDVTRAWIAFVSLLPCIEQLEIPRYSPSDNRVIIHGFADASTAAYGAAIYMQCPSIESKSTYLLCSKSRVAPIKPVTIPRLELCAPLLLSQLTQKGVVPKSGPISSDEYKDAEVCMLRWAQAQDFSSEIQTISKGKQLSDNATNFVGAQAELKKLHNLINYPDANLSNFLASDAIKWKFIPPVSPNFGGLWEAGVKSFKYHFRRAIGNANLTYEEFNTVTVEIEGILNSRPVTEISSDINDLEALTPGHFLTRRPINTVAEPESINVSDNRLSRWQRVEKLTQHIWKRWSSDYLNHFQQRHKWQFVKNNVKPGMMVILKEDNLPKCKWALGRIIDVIPGKDGYVRVVNVRTANGTLKRPISKVCLLPVKTDN